MRRRIAITGASGLLGTALLDEASREHEMFATSRSVGYQPPGTHWAAFDLHNDNDRRHWLNDVRPDALVYCAAIVDVDACERAEERAFDLHASIPESMARMVASWGTRFVYISTDSVFDGKEPASYSEAAPTHPLNSYARTKLAGEQGVSKVPGTTVLRTTFFGWSQQPRISFAEWVIRGLVNRDSLGMFNDVFFTPIHASHLAKMIVRVIKSGRTGLYHAAGAEKISKHEFALRLAAAFGLPSDTIYARRVTDAGLAAARPANMALSSERLSRDIGMPLPLLDDGLALLKRQYDSGWVAQIKGRPTHDGYQFWKES